jgi:hypothetical protein
MGKDNVDPGPESSGSFDLVSVMVPRSGHTFRAIIGQPRKNFSRKPKTIEQTIPCATAIANGHALDRRISPW